MLNQIAHQNSTQLGSKNEDFWSSGLYKFPEVLKDQKILSSK